MFINRSILFRLSAFTFVIEGLGNNWHISKEILLMAILTHVHPPPPNCIKEKENVPVSFWDLKNDFAAVGQCYL